MRRLLPIVLLVMVAACGGSSTVEAMIASSPGGIGVGDQRVLIGLVDTATDQLAASPDIEVVATLRDRIGSPLGEYQGEFVWIVPDVRGLYAFEFEIPGPGTFQVTLTAGEFGELGPLGLVTVEDPPGVGIGDPAPLSQTRTSADHDLMDITSDPEPDPSFYEMSVADAIRSGPTVIVFGTPAWCQSQACGPMLDQVKALSTEFPDLNYVHVEVYEDIHVASFDQLVPVAAVAEWELLSEPWVFVVDGEGLVSASFEGAVSDGELRAAFDRASP
jgi:hypothetical protein